MIKKTIARIVRTFRHVKALDELLEALAEEIERCERLQGELRAEKERRVQLESSLEMSKKILKGRDSQLEALNKRVSSLESELKSILEASLLRHLRGSEGKLDMKKFADEYGTNNQRILETLDVLQKKGLIKIEKE